MKTLSNTHKSEQAFEVMVFLSNGTYAEKTVKAENPVKAQIIISELAKKTLNLHVVGASVTPINSTLEDGSNNASKNTQAYSA
jgi:hypothetical protein